MPAYPGPGLAKPLNYNRHGYFWNNEIVPALTLSQAFRIERIDGSAYPWGLSVEVAFGASPGTFEIDIMAANNDNAANFVQIGSIIATASIIAGGFVGRYDMATNIWPRFVAAYVKTLGNAVGLTVQVTR